MAERNLLGYGPLQQLLDDPDVWEIMINAPDAVFVRRHRGPSGYHHELFHDDEHVARVLQRLLDDAAVSHRKLDPTEGLQDRHSSPTARGLHIVHRDVARGGHLLANIRRFTGVPFRRLDQLVEAGTLSDAAAQTLRRTSCGPERAWSSPARPARARPTLMSCLLAELDPVAPGRGRRGGHGGRGPTPQRRGHADPSRREGDRDAIDLRRLVAGFLRMAPDVAVVGEVRGPRSSAVPVDLVLGHHRLHDVARRLGTSGPSPAFGFVAQLDPAAGQLPPSALAHLVSEAIDVVVHLRRDASGPVIAEIVAVEDPLGGIGGAGRRP